MMTAILEIHIWETHKNNYHALEKIVMKMEVIHGGHDGQGGVPK